MAGSQHPSAYVHGVAVDVSWADDSASLTDLIFRGVTAALTDAGMTMDPVDSVVLAAHDLIDGLSLSSMVTSPAAGAYLRDEIRTTDDGLNALSLGAARIEAEESEWTVVAAWGRTSEGDYQHVSRYSFSPGLEQPFGLEDLSVSALRMSAWLGRYSGQAETRQAAMAARLKRAASNPRSLQGESRKLSLQAPLQIADAPKPGDIVVAAVLGRKPSPLRIAGVGHGTDFPSVGDRNMLAMPALKAAALGAAKAAQTELGAFDLFEIDGATLCDEALGLEALGLAAPGEGFATLARDTRFNPSGGSASAWSYPTNGLVRFAEACFQLRGTAGASQLPGALKRALATGNSAVAAQTVAAVALEAS